MFCSIVSKFKCRNLKQILEHSETQVLFVGKLDDFESMRAGIPTNMKCIAIHLH